MVDWPELPNGQCCVPGPEYIDISVINYSVTQDTPHTSITILANTSQNYPLHVQDEVQGS